MNREEAKKEIRSRAAELLAPDKSKRGYICPICGSGSHKKGTGITTRDGIHFKCWAGGCFDYADIIDIIGLQYSLTDYNNKLNKAAELLHISIDRDYRSEYSEYAGVGAARDGKDRAAVSKTAALSETNTPAEEKREKSEEGRDSEPDYSEYLTRTSARLRETDYLTGRGISYETAERFGVGYDDAWYYPSADMDIHKHVYTSKRLIIPTGKDGRSYTARDTEGRTDKRFFNVGKANLFYALGESVKVVFIVEGEIDALSIAEAGQSAVALGGTSNVGKMLAEIENGEYPDSVFVPALDNDEAGRSAQGKLIDGLNRLGARYYLPLGLYGDRKDANEALTSARESFIIRLAETAAAALSVTENPEYAAKKKEHLSNSAGARLMDFVNGIGIGVDTPCIRTGFDSLDDILDGGLYEGLYIIGAISSLGKTTFVMQMADSIASRWQGVLIFSLEMSRNELIAKSVSRHTYMRVLDYRGDRHNAKTARGITAGARYASYSDTEKKLITDAVRDYEQYADNIYIFEGIGDYGAERIRQTVEDHIRYTGRKPVVVIDYLQIIAPYDMRASDKQNTDKAVLELKRMSRDLKLSVLAVSSLNRGGYNTPASMESFKESGSIEYSSDVLIGLQLHGAGTSGFDVNEAKRQEPREIELVVLKNRSGRAGERAGFNYWAMFNFFEETGTV